MKSIRQLSIFALLLLASAILTGCGGGSGGASAAVPPSDFSGTWNGTYNGTTLVYLITQTGSSFTMTSTSSPITGLIHSGVITGNSAVVTTTYNGGTPSTANLNLTSPTTMTETDNTCTLPSWFVCVLVVKPLTFTKSSSSSSQSFPLQTAMTNLYAAASGIPQTITVSSTCGGTVTRTNDTAATTIPATSFGSTASALLSRQTIYFTYSDNSIASAYATVYYDNHYLPLGIDMPGKYYGVYDAPPTTTPLFTIGASGVIRTGTLWTTSSQLTNLGTIVVSYAVIPDTTPSATTALVIITNTMYDTQTPANVIETEQDSWRIDSTTTTLTPVSVNTNCSVTPTVFTYP